jgi:hypothetical protein
MSAILDRTCIHHTDAERAEVGCPICISRERDAAETELAAAHEAARRTAENSMMVLLEVEEARDEAKKQAALGWERHAEKDRAYQAALDQRDEARAALHVFLEARKHGGYGMEDAENAARAALEGAKT